MKPKITSLINQYIGATSDEEAEVYENRLMVAFYVPMILIIALANVVLFLLSGYDKRTTILNSVYLVGIAVMVWTANRFVQRNSLKSLLITLSFAIFLAFTIIQYYPLLGPIVWVIASAFIVISIGRNDFRFILSIIITLALIAVYLNVKYYGEIKTVNTLALIIIIVGILAIAYLVKTINTRRISLLREQINHADIMSQISSQMIELNILNADQKITGFLCDYGSHFVVDRVGIFLLAPDKKTLKYSYEWCAANISPTLGMVENFELSRDSWLLSQKGNRRLILINDVTSDQIISAKARNIMLSFGIKSAVYAPLLVNGSLHGFLVHQTVNHQQTWREDQMTMTTVYANLLSDSFAKLQKDNEINQMAYYDTLTGLPNRFLFNSTVDEAIIKAEAANGRFAILFIDMDSFKAINDTMGHEGGDRLLRQFAAILRQELSPLDFAARFGGDEFIVLLDRAESLKSVSDRAARIMATFNQPITVNDQEFFVSASGGIAQFPEDGQDRETLIKNADLAMYSAKESGKNQYKFCTVKMKADVERKVQLTNLLYKAQDNGELLLFYQPQVDLSTRKIVGLEALLRWSNPEKGMISPGVFIPLAEQSGLINPIGQWVLETACRQCMTWQRAGYPPLRISINLSIEQFRNPNLVQMITRTLEATGLDAGCLELEITESIAIKEKQDVIPILAELKHHGITISIDDFGTDYSSLARIKNLPIDRIKMAMEFVHGITVSDKDEAIAMVIITLANKLGLKVIAEGVETDAQLKFLEKHGCEEIQGYYFYKPMPAEEVEKLFDKR